VRALTHLLGAWGFCAVVAISRSPGASGMHLFRAGNAGPTKDRNEPRMASTAKMLWGVYVLLIVALIFLLRLGGMDCVRCRVPFLRRAGHGRVLHPTASVAAYDSVYIEQ
jgi:trk system potassium uptake protein TrkH